MFKVTKLKRAGPRFELTYLISETRKQGGSTLFSLKIREQRLVRLCPLFDNVSHPLGRRENPNY